MADLIDLEARISALEMIVVTHILQSGVGVEGFDPTSFAASRRDAWAAVGKAVCDGCSSETDEHRFAQAYARALERIGHLLVALAQPVQEAVDEFMNAPASAFGGDVNSNSLQDAPREAPADLGQRASSSASAAGAGDIG